MILNLTGVGDKAVHIREGILNAKPKKNHLTYTDHEHLRSTTYYYTPKVGQSEAKAESRLKYSYQNYMTEPSPFDYYGTPEYDEKVAEFAQKATDVWVANQKLYSKLKKKRSDKRLDDPLDQDITLSLEAPEIEDIKDNPDAIAARLLETSLEMVRLYTNKKEICNDLHIKMHLDTDNPHAHIRIGYYNRFGEPLRLAQCAKKLGNVHYQMEQNVRKFPWLSKIRTNAWEEQGRLIPEDVSKPIVDKVVSILQQYENDPINARKALVAAGITTNPLHIRNRLENIEFTYKGETISTKYNFPKESLPLAFKHIELMDFHKETKIDVSNMIPTLEEILNKHKNKSITELNKQLNSLGFLLEPNIKKDGNHGWAFVWKDTNSRLKSSRIDFNQSNYSFTESDLVNLTNQAKEYKKQFKLENTEPAVGEAVKVISGKRFRKDKNGNWVEAGGFIGFERKKKKKKYMRWEKYKTETLEEFIARISEQRTMLALIKNIEMIGNVGINKRLGTQAFKVLSENKIQFTENNASSIRAALQVLIAQNQLTKEEIASGVKLTIKITGGSQDFLDKLWIEAKLAGIEPLGFEPTLSARNKMKEAMDNDLLKHRINNKQNLVKYHNATMAGANPEDQTLRINYNTKLEIEVDRRAIALAYVDAWLMGLDPKRIILDPPGSHPYSRNRALREDLIENHKLMLDTVKKERPDLLEQFRKEIYAYSPEAQHIEPEKPMEKVLDKPKETPASQPEMEDLPEYKEEQKRKEKPKSN